MPTSRQTKKPKKSKTTEKTIVKSPHSIGVKDCMVWPDKKGQSKQSPEQQQAQRETVVRPTKGALGRPTLRHYEVPEPSPRADPGEDEGTVRQAMQGWPHSGLAEDEQDMDEYEAYMNSLNQEEPKTNEGKKKKGKKGSVENMDPKKDPHISDLVSHRFMADAIEERQRKLDKEREAEERERQMEKQRKFPKDIKATKTTQLRSIALAENVPVDPKDLWQMPKFKGNAKASISTSRSKKGKGRTSGLGGNDTNRMDDGNVDPQGYACTCGEEQNGFYNEQQIPDPKEYPSPAPLAEGEAYAL